MRWFLSGFVAVFCVFALGSADIRAEAARYCFNEWPPYAFENGAGQAEGISVTILKEAARRAGYEAVFTELPWERCLRDVEIGEQDAVIDAARRDAYLQGDVSFSVYTNTFWVRQDFGVEPPVLSSIGGKNLGLVRGYVYGDVLDGEIEQSGAIVDFAQDDEQNARKLAYGRVDAIIGDFIGTRVIAKTYGLDIKPVLPHHSYDRLYPSFNKARIDMHTRINAALGQMIKDGAIDRIYHDALGVHFSDVMPMTGHSANPASAPQADSDLATAGF